MILSIIRKYQYMVKVACKNCNGELVQEESLSDVKSEPNYCTHCGTEIDHKEILDEKGYENKGQAHLYAPNFSASNLPYQGWKIHISATPFETYILSEQLLPKLINQNINHKVVDSKKRLDNWIESDDKNKYKSIVIYPGIDSNKDWAMKQFPDIGNAQVFIKNPKDRKTVINGEKKPEKGINIANINSNHDNAENAIELVENLLNSCSVPVRKTNKVPDVHRNQSNEKNVIIKGTKTRVSYRYDIIYSGKGVEVNNSKILRQNLAQLKRDKANSTSNHWRPLKDTDAVVGSEGRKIKNYKEAVDVLNYEGFRNPFS